MRRMNKNENENENENNNNHSNNSQSRTILIQVPAHACAGDVLSFVIDGQELEVTVPHNRNNNKNDDDFEPLDVLQIQVATTTTTTTDTMDTTQEEEEETLVLGENGPTLHFLLSLDNNDDDSDNDKNDNNHNRTGCSNWGGGGGGNMEDKSEVLEDKDRHTTVSISNNKKKNHTTRMMDSKMHHDTRMDADTTADDDATTTTTAVVATTTGDDGTHGMIWPATKLILEHEKGTLLPQLLSLSGILPSSSFHSPLLPTVDTTPIRTTPSSSPHPASPSLKSPPQQQQHDSSSSSLPSSSNTSIVFPTWNRILELGAGLGGFGMALVTHLIMNMELSMSTASSTSSLQQQQQQQQPSSSTREILVTLTDCATAIPLLQANVQHNRHQFHPHHHHHYLATTIANHPNKTNNNNIQIVLDKEDVDDDDDDDDKCSIRIRLECRALDWNLYDNNNNGDMKMMEDQNQNHFLPKHDKHNKDVVTCTSRKQPQEQTTQLESMPQSDTVDSVQPNPCRESSLSSSQSLQPSTSKQLPPHYHHHEEQTYDWIIGSDLLYNIKQIPALIQTIDQLLHIQHGCILLIVRWRKPDLEYEFFNYTTNNSTMQCNLDWTLVFPTSSSSSSSSSSAAFPCTLDWTKMGNPLCEESNEYFGHNVQISISGHNMNSNESSFLMATDDTKNNNQQQQQQQYNETKQTCKVLADITEEDVQYMTEVEYNAWERAHIQVYKGQRRRRQQQQQ